MQVGEAPIRWWSGSTFLSPKPEAISRRQASSLSSVFFQRSLQVLPWRSASLRGGGTLPTPFILPSRRWRWLPMTFTVWLALASIEPSSVWTICRASSWALTCWGGSTPMRPSATSAWCWITCSSYRGPRRNVSVWLRPSFSTCWEPTSLPMAGKWCL